MTRFSLENPAMVGIASSQPDDIGVESCGSFFIFVVLHQSFPGQHEKGHVPHRSSDGVVVMLGGLWG